MLISASLVVKKLNMKTILSLFFLSIVSTGEIFCQEITNDILTSSEKRDGVYLTFHEFRTNSPSLPGEVIVTNNRLKMRNTSSGKFENIKKDFWGACRNDTVYIFLKDTHGPQSPHIFPLQIIGRYCYFKEVGLAVYTMGSAMTQGTVEAQYVLNINNGQTYKLSRKVMMDILQKDERLLKEFEAENGVSDVFKKYIVLVNASRKADIKDIP
jgi:hypothetical protein